MARFTVEVPAPPRSAFDYLADPRHRPQWQSSLRAVTVLDAGPPRVGTRWLDRTAVGAAPRLRIVEMNPPTAGGTGTWAELGEWHGLRAYLHLTFSALAGDRTALGVDLRVRSSLPWVPVRLVLQALAPPAVRADLRRAARILERRAGE